MRTLIVHTFITEDGEMLDATASELEPDVVAHVSRLKAAGGPDLHLHPSWDQLQALIAHDLVDEHRLWVFRTPTQVAS